MYILYLQVRSLQVKTFMQVFITAFYVNNERKSLRFLMVQRIYVL